MSTRLEVSRREFLQTASAAGSALVLGFWLPACRGEAGSEAPPLALNAWLRIGADDSVLVLVDRSEMGQGITTSLPMLVAEELEADWSKVRIEFAPADPAYANPLFGIQATGGSSSVRAAWAPLRQAGAAAREMLITAAAETWGVERSGCRAERGEVLHDGSRRRARFGQLVERASQLSVPQDAPLKDAADWNLIGTRVSRLDTPIKVDGSAQFGIDVRIPGMLVATIARCPVIGGTVARFTDDAARAVPGVRQVAQVSSGVAVIADGYWSAKKGRDALDITWDEGRNANTSSASIATQLERLTSGSGISARRDGNPDTGLRNASRRVEAIYDTPFLAHATMEPMNATAHVRSDGVDIWAPTQFQEQARALGAQIGGVPLEQVRVHTTYLGGGFGGRFEMDFIRDALEVSKVAGAPVKVVWSREDDTQQDQYRPATRHRMRAGVDAAGRPVAWDHRIVAPSIAIRAFPALMQNGLDTEAVEGAVGLPYSIANVGVDYVMADTGIPVGFWRSVNHSFNAFVVECFIDELAYAAGQDPFEYRRALLQNAPRHLGVLERAALEAGWGTPPPAGRSRGIAVWKSFESWVAEVAEVSVAPDGRVRVHRVVCAVDCGPVVNPDIVEAQIESAVVFGLTAALMGEITIEQGRVRESNFHDYPILSMRDMPVVDTHLVVSTDTQGGIGEVGTPPIAPAVCNAIFAATGKRIRRLPIRRVVRSAQ